MFGIIIVGHLGLAREYLAIIEHVVGTNLRIEAISIFPNDNTCYKEKQISEALIEVDEGSGVVIVTDMHGSTPANLAMKAAKGANCKVIVGANLPLLLKLVKVRHLSLNEGVEKALIAGRKYIDCVDPVS